MKTLKILIATAGGLLAANSRAIGHEGEMHAAGSGLFGLPPEYVHVLINPMPVYGMAMGILALGAALLARNKTAQAIGLGLIFIAAASAWPVAYYGQNAYKNIHGQADDAGQDALDEHMAHAEKVIYVFYATAFIGFVALVSLKKFPKAATPLAIITFIMGITSLGAGGWISKAGGQIRHPEFRVMSATSTNAESHEHDASEPPHDKVPSPGASSHKHEMTMADETSPTNAAAEKHNMSEQSHKNKPTEDMSGHQHEASAPEHENMSSTNDGGHQHAMQMPDQATGKTSMPGTIEGVWKAIHEHHTELESSVDARDFKQVKFHAAIIGDLIGRLGELAPDANGDPGKITHALDELKSSADTGSDTVMKIRFKEFEAALAQLQSQMKK